MSETWLLAADPAATRLVLLEVQQAEGSLTCFHVKSISFC